MRFHLTTPADNPRGPSYMAIALAEVRQWLASRPPLELVIGTADGQLGFWIEGPQAERVSHTLLGQYPEAMIVTESTGDPTDSRWIANVTLTGDALPLRSPKEFEDTLNRTLAEPLSGVLRSLLPAEGVALELRFTIAAASRRRVRRYRRGIGRCEWQGDPPFPANCQRLLLRVIRRTVQSVIPQRPQSPSAEMVNRQMRAIAKLDTPLFAAAIRIAAVATADRKPLVRERMTAVVAALNGLTAEPSLRFSLGTIRRKPRRHAGTLLSPNDLALLWHPPTASTAAERFRLRNFRELEAPADIPAETDAGAVTLGHVAHRDDERPVRLTLEDRRRHLYIVGRTGMGKTTLIQGMIAADMAAGRGLCLIDPHGDLAETVLGLVPKARTNDVISFDAGLRDGVVGFNPLACRDERQVDQVTSAVVSAFKKIHASWGPRLEDTLRNAVFAVVEQHGTLMDVMRLLGERPYRDAAIARIRDPVVRSFWEHEFSRWSENYRVEAVAAIQNKVRPFLTNTHMRAIVSRAGDGIDLRSIMDAGQILVVNLSKGRVGEDNSTLLGAFLVASLQQAAMTRADMPEAARRDFFLYVDEFQNFVSGSFATILSEARKFRLSLCCVHQYLSQLDESTTGAVFGNVGSMVSFQVGSDDADVIARQMSQFDGQVRPADLTGLPKYTAYARLLNGGLPTRPFSFRTLPPDALGRFDPERAEIVKRVSLRRFGS